MGTIDKRKEPVVALHGDYVVKSPGEPVPALIERLEALLGDAKAGRIQAIAFVTVDAGDERSRTGWATSYQTAGDKMLGAIARLMHEYASA